MHQSDKDFDKCLEEYLTKLYLFMFCYLCCIVKNYSYGWNASGSTVAGIGSGGNSQQYSLNKPIQVVVDSNDTLYISDSQNHRIQQWLLNAPSGTTIAGKQNGGPGNSSSELFNPEAVVLDSSNGIYIADAKNHRIVHWVKGASNGTLIAGTGRFDGKNSYTNENNHSLCDTYGFQYL